MPSTEHQTSTQPGADQQSLPLTWPQSLAPPLAVAHFVRLRPGSKLPAGPWRHTRPAATAVREWTESGGGAGIVPASVDLHDLCGVVLDVDHGDAGRLCEAYPPVSVAQTRRGVHAWYLSNLAWGNGTFDALGCAGDVRGTRGYVRLWPAATGGELVDLDTGVRSMLSGAIRLGIGRSPDHLLAAKASGPAAAAVRADLAEADRLLRAALATARAVDIGAAVGGRHVRLVRRLAKWAGRRTWNGRAVDPWFMAGRAAAYLAGMPGDFSISEAAGILAWAIGLRDHLRSQPHAAAWLATQAARGRASGRVRYAGSVTQRQPWERLHQSRATWYRRMVAERLAATMPLPLGSV